MVRIKLSKGLSYSGIVNATKKNPYVDTDEETANQAVATGYFEIVAAAKVEEKGEETNTVVNATTGTDGAAATDTTQKAIGKMTKPELEAYAAEKGIDISSCANNEQRIALIKEVEEKGEETAAPDFTQE